MGVSLSVPLLDQLSEQGNNQQDNCVPVALAAGLRRLRPGLAVTGYELKALCVPPYGPGYLGFQDAANYASLLFNRWGVRLVRVPATLAAVQRALASGFPVLGTIPSDWDANPPTSQFSHVVCLSGDDSANLTAMNPWHGVWLTRSYAWWSTRLLVWLWIMESGVQPVSVNVNGLGPGDAAEAEREGASVVLAEKYVGNQSVATLDNGTALYWDGAQVHAISGGAAVVALLYHEVDRLAAQVADLTAKLAAQPQPAAMGPGEVEAYTAFLAMQKAFKALPQ